MGNNICKWKKATIWSYSFGLAKVSIYFQETWSINQNNFSFKHPWIFVALSFITVEKKNLFRSWALFFGLSMILVCLDLKILF